MSVQIKTARLARRKMRIRRKVSGTPERPRLSFFRSNRHFAAQAIDDLNGHTLAALSTHEAEVKGKLKHNTESAAEMGKLLAGRLKEKKITSVVFDRNGRLYHGRIKAFVDAVREAGIQV